MVEISKGMQLTNFWATVGVICLVLAIVWSMIGILLTFDNDIRVIGVCIIIIAAILFAFSICINTMGTKEETINVTFQGTVDWDEIKEQYEILDYENGIWKLKER